MTAVRVVIADDHPMFRYGLRSALDGVAADVEVVGEAADGRELVDLVDSTKPDVVLTDLTMPGLDGIAAIPQVLQAHPGVAVLVLSMLTEDGTLLRVLRSGARGYVLKGADRAEIVRAILTVASGGTVYGGQMWCCRRRPSATTSRPSSPSCRSGTGRLRWRGHATPAWGRGWPGRTASRCGARPVRRRPARGR